MVVSFSSAFALFFGGGWYTFAPDVRLVTLAKPYIGVCERGWVRGGLLSSEFGRSHHE